MLVEMEMTLSDIDIKVHEYETEEDILSSVIYIVIIYMPESY